jgi:hypothetical protein
VFLFFAGKIARRAYIRKWRKVNPVFFFFEIIYFDNGVLFWYKKTGVGKF